MAKHKHLVLDFEAGEIIGLGLPADAAPGPAPDIADFRRNIILIGAKNGVNQTFTTPDKFVRTPFTEVVYHNGVVQEEGAGNDYTLSESGGPGTGYDTVHFSIAPYAWEKLTIDYMIKP